MPNPMPPACDGCPARSVGRGFVPYRGPLDAPLACIGQGPGKHEYLSGLPFVGPTGYKLRDWLLRSGYNPDHIYYDNVVRCWLPGDRQPKASEVAFCRQAHWQADLDRCTSPALVCVGMAAARTLLDPSFNETALGLIKEVEL